MIDMVKGIANINTWIGMEWGTTSCPPTMRKLSSMFIRIPGRILKNVKHRIRKNKSNRHYLQCTIFFTFDISKILRLKYIYLPKSVWKSWVSRMSTGRGQNNNCNKNDQMHFVREIGWLYDSLYKWSILLFHLFVFLNFQFYICDKK